MLIPIESSTPLTFSGPCDRLWVQKIDASVLEQRQAQKERAGQAGKVSQREKMREKRAEALKRRLLMKRRDGQRPMPRKMQKAMEARTANVRSMKVR